MFNQKDTTQIQQRGSSVRDVEEQIEHFKKGFPWMKIVGPATPERGIRVLSEAEADAAIRYYDGAAIAGKCKFVPASGAASRMFKDIFAGLATLEKGEDLPADAAGSRLAAQIEKFAFYSEELFGKKEDTAAYRKSVLKKVLKYAPLKSDFLRGLTADETVKSTLDAEMFDVPNEVDYADYVEVDQNTGEVLSTPADAAAEVQS